MHLFVDNLTNVDFSYLHPQRGVVGETWLASIILEGALDKQGMVCDFGIVKKTLRNWLDETIDHCLLVPKTSASLKQLNTDTNKNSDNNIELEWEFGEANTRIQCSSPKQAITIIDDSSISPESVSRWCVKQLRELLPDTIDRIILSFKPEAIQSDFYHYSHGLKKHAGNCQRIAHGHRSTIEIMCDDVRSSELEKMWCEKWRDIYIGSSEDLVDTRNIGGEDYYNFKYRSQQGDFTLNLPVKNCYLIESDTTVELIAQHIATEIKKQKPNNNITVKAYEGIAKGAIAFA